MKTRRAQEFGEGMWSREITVKKSFHRDPEARLIWLLPDEQSDCVSGHWNNVFPLFMAWEHEKKSFGECFVQGTHRWPGNWDILEARSLRLVCLSKHNSSSSSRRRLRCDNIQGDATSAVVFLNHSQNRKHETFKWCSAPSKLNYA